MTPTVKIVDQNGQPIEPEDVAPAVGIPADVLRGALESANTIIGQMQHAEAAAGSGCECQACRTRRQYYEGRLSQATGFDWPGPA